MHQARSHPITGTPTPFTETKPLSLSVHLHVADQRVLPIEASAADFAMKSVRKMRFLVFDKVGGVRATEVADVTPVRFFACVSTAVNSYPCLSAMQTNSYIVLMLTHLTFVARCLRAKLALDRLFPRVDPLMDHQLTFGGACLFAETANIISIIRVRESVTNKLVYIGQGFAVATASIPSADC